MQMENALQPQIFVLNPQETQLAPSALRDTNSKMECVCGHQLED